MAEDLLKKYTFAVDSIKASANGKPMTIAFSQGDVKTAILIINLTENDTALDLTGKKVRVSFKKSDGTSVMQDMTTGISFLDAATGKIQIQLSTQALSARGNVRGQISISDEVAGLVAETAEFTFVVRESIVNTSIISTDELPIIEEMIEASEILGEVDLQTIVNNTTNVNSLKSEVETARGASANLAGRFSSVESSLAQKANYRQNDNATSPNMIAGFEGNAIADNLYACTIDGGGTVGRENMIGATENMAIGTHDTNVPDNTTEAHYSVIGGGYDNVANGLASVLTGFHCLIRKTATHATISGGSGHEIAAGDYNTIGAGTQNKIEGGSNNIIAGGQLNILDGSKSARTIAGGTGNKVTGTGAVVSGGTGNKAIGDYSVVVGGYNNQATGGNSSVGGGGGNNISSGLGSAILSGIGNNASGGASVINGGDSNIASADYSAIGGGANNKAIAQYSVVNGGRYNEAQKQFSNVSGGKTNIANGDYSSISGGDTNATNGAYSSVTGGLDNIADGTSSTAHGQSARARTHGQVAHAYGKFVTQGDAQESRMVLKNQTADATLTVIGLNGAAHPQMPNDSSWYFKYTVVARRQDVEGETKAWTVEGLAQNNTGVNVQIVSSTKTVIAETANATAWDVTVGSGADSLYVQGKGEAAKTIYWVAKLETVEVIA
jgi:hypothetical protein